MMAEINTDFLVINLEQLFQVFLIQKKNTFSSILKTNKTFITEYNGIKTFSYIYFFVCFKVFKFFVQRF